MSLKTRIPPCVRWAPFEIHRRDPMPRCLRREMVLIRPVATISRGSRVNIPSRNWREAFVIELTRLEYVFESDVQWRTRESSLDSTSAT